MSRNIVDAVIDVGGFGLIPSRRQVDYLGGYVNKWTTDKFAQYVNGRVLIQRDHAGASQGHIHDLGYTSLEADCRNFNMIHIDPWKAYPLYDQGLEVCIENLKYCYSLNSNIRFEVGTEAAIKEFPPESLFTLLIDLELGLKPEIFEAIEYVTIQSGVGLDLGKMANTGTFNQDNMERMLSTCDAFCKKSKEHNGDYLSDEEYKLRFDLGLDAINIAPEFGQLETLCYLNEMGDDIEDFYQICYKSGRWRKWVAPDFVPEDNKRELIQICGHYVFSNKEFLEIKPDIDDKIKEVITNKLISLRSLV